ncbi:MAG: hypothetical protein WDW38_010141 [Sanguina aurantia]
MRRSNLGHRTLYHGSQQPSHQALQTPGSPSPQLQRHPSFAGPRALASKSSDTAALRTRARPASAGILNAGRPQLSGNDVQQQQQQQQRQHGKMSFFETEHTYLGPKVMRDLEPAQHGFKARGPTDFLTPGGGLSLSARVAATASLKLSPVNRGNRPSEVELAKWLPVFIDGVREYQEPYRFLAIRGSQALVAEAGPKLHQFATGLVLEADPLVAQQWVGHLWQFCQVLNLFRSRSLRVSMGYNSRQVRVLQTSIDRLLLLLEEGGGPTATAHIRRYATGHDPALTEAYYARRSLAARNADAPSVTGGHQGGVKGEAEGRPARAAAARLAILSGSRPGSRSAGIGAWGRGGLRAAPAGVAALSSRKGDGAAAPAPNVVEAREWIGAWKARMAGGNRLAGAPSWAPGFTLPAHLDGTLRGDFGFDPLNLGADEGKLKWYVEAELQHARWAMLAIPGILVPEILTNVGFDWPAKGVSWVDAGKYEYFAPTSTLIVVQAFLFAWVEARRYMDIVKPGSANQDPLFSNQKLPDGNETGYPGGIFDPMNKSKGDFATQKLKEIKNGRLAMVAFVGFAAQAVTTGTTPLANLSAHLANPWGTTVLSNEIARLVQ